MERSFYISQLIQKHLHGELTAAETIELNNWLSADPQNQQAFDELNNQQWVADGLEKMSGYSEKAGREKIAKEWPAYKTPVIAMQKRWWFRVAAAAAIIIIATTAIIVFNNKTKNDIAKTEPSKDVKAPEGNRAVIILANGQKLYLDSADNGTLATQGNIKLVKLSNGQIAYQTASGEVVKEIQYNTLSNPRGSKVIDMTLADGSHVWLNAGSSVTYPVAFVSNERKVSITGEAYFEVVHNTAMPFVVSKGETSIQVLGTHFNVNAYDDEENIKVTLLEGSVKVNNGNTSGLLKPGQQAQISGDVKVVNSADVDAVMAWKNGLFKFNEASLETVMREIARWYAVEINYQSKPTMRFGGKMDRNSTLMQVLKILEESGVKFKLEGKTLTVL